MCAKMINETKIMSSFKLFGRAYIHIEGDYVLISNGCYVLLARRDQIKIGGRLDKKIHEEHDPLSGKMTEDLHRFLNEGDGEASVGEYIGEVIEDGGRKLEEVRRNDGFNFYFDPKLANIITSKKALVDGTYVSKNYERTKHHLANLYYEKRDKNGGLVVKFMLLPLRSEKRG